MKASFAPLALLLVGCGSTTSLVPRGPHPAHDAVESVAVAYPPPAAKVEVLPLQRRSDCQWQGGHYRWTSNGWEWVDGAWVLAPSGCYYAPPTTTWRSSSAGGRLMHQPGHWYRGDPDAPPERPAGEPCAQPKRCGSLVPLGSPYER